MSLWAQTPECLCVSGSESIVRDQQQQSSITWNQLEIQILSTPSPPSNLLNQTLGVESSAVCCNKPPPRGWYKNLRSSALGFRPQVKRLCSAKAHPQMF